MTAEQRSSFAQPKMGKLQGAIDTQRGSATVEVATMARLDVVILERNIKCVTMGCCVVVIIYDMLSNYPYFITMTNAREATLNCLLYFCEGIL